MTFSPVVQQLIAYPLAIGWIVVGCVIGFRALAKRIAYLRHFEHEIDFFAGDPLFIPASFRAYRAALRVMWEPQADPALEALRRAMWWRLGYYVIWIFGFPVLVIAMAVLVIATGLVRLQ